jgi:hypothetical protein
MTKHAPHRSVWGDSSHLTDPNRDDEHPHSLAAGHSKSLTAISRDLGSCVYFIRCKDGLIKIGWTSDLAQRKRSFGSGWQHILAVLPGDSDDERRLHKQFAAHLARGREYFTAAPELVEHINEIRVRMGVQPIAA